MTPFAQGGSSCQIWHKSLPFARSPGDDTSQVTVPVVPGRRQIEACVCESGPEQRVLGTAELDHEATTWAQERRRVVDDPADKGEPVVATVEGPDRLVPLDVGREQVPRTGRHVRRDRGDDVDRTGQVEWCGQVADDDPYAVVRRARRRARIELDTHDERVGRRAPEHRGHRAAAGAQVDRDATRRQEGGGAARQLLALLPGDVHARRRMQHETAEADATGDPRQRLTVLASPEARLELGGIRRVVEQLARLLDRRDATGRGEPRDDRRGGRLDQAIKQAAGCRRGAPR